LNLREKRVNFKIYERENFKICKLKFLEI